MDYRYEGEYLVGFTDANGHAHSYAYDDEGRLLAVSPPREDTAVVNVYDGQSRDASQRFPDGDVIKFEYDPLNRLVQYVDAEGYGFSQEHDENGNVTKTADGWGNSKQMSYDALDRLASTTVDQGYKAREYSYDSLGNLTYEKIHNKGTDYKYNSLNQITRRIEDGKDNYTYGYDRRGNQDKEVYNKNLNNPKHDEVVATYACSRHKPHGEGNERLRRAELLHQQWFLLSSRQRVGRPQDIFKAEKGGHVPNSIQELLELPDIIKAIAKGLRNLGY